MRRVAAAAAIIGLVFWTLVVLAVQARAAAVHGATPGCVSTGEAAATYRGETQTHFTYRVGPDAQYERDPLYPMVRYYRGCFEQTPTSPVFVVGFCRCMNDKIRVTDAIWGRL